MVYTYVDHKADIGVIVDAATVEEVVHDAARALLTLICDLQTVTPSHTFPLVVSAPEKDRLIVSFLNELLYMMDAKGLFFVSCSAVCVRQNTEGYELHACMHGEKQDRRKHNIKTEVKAVTYSGLYLHEDDNGCRFQCLFDV